MNYHFEDFTEDNYKRLCDIAQRQYSFIDYETLLDGKPREKSIIWRHDIDFSPHRALRTALIESQMGIKSIYFILFSGYFYNPMEWEIVNIIQRIIELGHEVGIHLDCEAYSATPTKENIEEDLEFYKNVFYKIYGGVIPKSFSFHNPSSECINRNGDERYAGLFNAYCSRVMKDVGYCSDSNGYWRFERLEDFLNKNDMKYACVLTHPGWWVEKSMSPWERIQRSIDGRAEASRRRYLKALDGGNRTNVRGND